MLTLDDEGDVYQEPAHPNTAFSALSIRAHEPPLLSTALTFTRQQQGICARESYRIMEQEGSERAIWKCGGERLLDDQYSELC